jgi:hypothetical protein
MKKKLCLSTVLVLLGVGFWSGVSAQTSIVGSISGTVRDSQGAAVPKAEVTIEEETTGQTRTVKTDESGAYSSQSLPEGRYRVSTARQGLMKPVARVIDLLVGD